MPGDFPCNLLKRERRPMEKFQSSSNSLQEVFFIPFRTLISWPGYSANLRHGRETIVHLGRVAVGLPRITPGPVDGDSSGAGRVLARNVVLVISTRQWKRIGHKSLPFSFVHRCWSDRLLGST